MISLTFANAVPVLEPLGRSKNLTHRVSTRALGGAAAVRITRMGRGWLIQQEVEKIMAGMEIPATWVPDENVTSVEGDAAELRALIDGAAAPSTKRTKAA